MPDITLNPPPAEQPHVAVRVHLSALAAQKLPGSDDPRAGCSACRSAPLPTR